MEFNTHLDTAEEVSDALAAGRPGHRRTAEGRAEP